MYLGIIGLNEFDLLLLSILRMRNLINSDPRPLRLRQLSWSVAFKGDLRRVSAQFFCHPANHRRGRDSAANRGNLTLDLNLCNGIARPQVNYKGNCVRSSDQIGRKTKVNAGFLQPPMRNKNNRRKDEISLDGVERIGN
jgi:hypothetical protein